MSSLTSLDFEGIAGELGKAASSLFGEITTPFPTPPKAKPIAPTAFEISPFMEKVTMDPYKTYDINELSKAQLSIDNVVDFLSSLLPKDLVDSIGFDKNSLKLMADKSLSVEELVRNVSQSLPKGGNISLDGLMREGATLSDIYQGLNSINTILTASGESINSISECFLGKTLAYFGNINLEFPSVLGLNLDIDPCQLNNVGELPFDGNLDSELYAQSAVSLGVIDLKNSSNTTLNNVLVAANVDNNISTLAICTVTKSEDATYIANVVKAISVTDRQAIVNYLKTHSIDSLLALTEAVIREYQDTWANGSTSIAKATVQIVTGVRSIGCKNYSDLLDREPVEIESFGYLLRVLSPLSVKGWSDLLSIRNRYSIDKVTTAVTKLATLLSTGDYNTIYASIHGDSSTDILTRYGVTQKDLLSLLVVTKVCGRSKIVTVISTVYLLTNVSLYLAIVTLLVQSDNPKRFADTMLGNDTTIQKSIVDLGLNYGIDGIGAMISVINSTSVTAANRFLSSVNNTLDTLSVRNLTTPTKTPVECIDILFNTFGDLTSKQIKTVINQMSVTEPSLKLPALTTSSSFSIYLLRKTITLLTSYGKILGIEEIIVKYPTVFTSEYRFQIIRESLVNFKLTKDLLALTLPIACFDIERALEVILPKWYNYNMLSTTSVKDFIVDNDNIPVTVLGEMLEANYSSVYRLNHSPWMTASDDFLTLMLESNELAISAKLQLDRRYSL